MSNVEAVRRYYLKNRDQVLERAKARNARPTVKQQRRKYMRLWKYGVSHEQWLEMLEEQDGLCAICYDEPATDLDHNHATGGNRRPLCRECNKGLGGFRDNPAFLRHAAEYLEDHCLV
jgi:Recombination endonuclease VII